MRGAAAGFLLLLAAACRQPIAVDTSAARLIPRDVAVERLMEVLATADAAACTAPRRWLGREEIREWKIDDLGLEARAAGKAPIRVDFKDVTEVRLEKVNLFYQVRIFAPAQPDPKKDYVHLDWASEAPARRALELIEALRQKP